MPIATWIAFCCPFPYLLKAMFTALPLDHVSLCLLALELAYFREF